MKFPKRILAPSILSRRLSLTDKRAGAVFITAAPVAVLLVRTAILIAALTLCVNIISCSDDSGDPNQPPRVWLSGNPPEGSTTSYRIQMVWGGFDPDGEIKYYEYVVTDNDGGTFDPADTTGRDKWSKAYGNQKNFNFTADQPADTNSTDMVQEFIRSHTFFIRAVDNEGLASPVPAYRSFTARNLSPRVYVVTPPATGIIPAVVPPIVTYHWTAEDFIDDFLTDIEPDSVSWILESITDHEQSWDQTTDYIRNLPVNSPDWDRRGGWRWYGAPDGSGKSWTTPPIAPDWYVFALRAKDEAGAITPVFDLAYNVRRIAVREIETGPILKVQNEYLGTVITATCNPPLTITNLPAGVHIDFCWEASADHYGGTVTGYRYGWDIDDLSDPAQWEIDWTPFTNPQACSPYRQHYFGTHVFTVEVIDNNGFCSRSEFKINIVQFPMENNLLVIDDYAEGTATGWNDPIAPGLTPSDQEHDEFWEDVLQDLDGFVPAGNVRELHIGDVVSLADLAHYKSIIWSVYGHVENPGLSVLHEYVKFVDPDRDRAAGGFRRVNILDLYMAAGGHVLICGNHPVSVSIDPSVSLSSFRFPINFLYELLGDQTSMPNQGTPLIGMGSFAYKSLCLETMDFAFTDLKRRRQYGNSCPVHAVRTVPDHALRDHTMRGAEPVDLGFPRLDLRSEAAATGQAYHVTKRGYDAEVYAPQYFSDLCPSVHGPRGCFEPIYALDCLDAGEPTYGAPVAFWTSQYALKLADAPGAVRARSAVFGFPLVYFEPYQVREVMWEILFEEWQLPHK